MAYREEDTSAHERSFTPEALRCEEPRPTCIVYPTVPDPEERRRHARALYERAFAVNLLLVGMSALGIFMHVSQVQTEEHLRVQLLRIQRTALEGAPGQVVWWCASDGEPRPAWGQGPLDSSDAPCTVYACKERYSRTPCDAGTP
jgi:hypothetical protein